VHERTIRELRLGPNDIQVGEPLAEFDGVLTGVPTYKGGEGMLMKVDPHGLHESR
jgi:circadian clock protein KaiC